ncbi:MAG: helix-turn-helix transcriptional regulator [Victivallales bacterium]|nr:helix-turn-helix transcriptional regulator [Victivallales bacterium]
MARNLRFVSVKNGKSILEGFNFEGFPKHHFRYLNIPVPTYPLWVPFCGLDEWRKECFRKRTCSDTFAVEFVQQGTFIFQQNHITKKVKPGEIFFLHLGADNSIRCKTDFAVKRTVSISGPLLHPLLETLGLNRINTLAPCPPQRIEGWFERIYKFSGETSLESRREISSACYSLLVELAEQVSFRQRPKELQRALEYIHGHLDETLRLEELTCFAGTSSATLHRLFRKHLKTSPINFFLNQKLERAKALLENNPYTVKEVAGMLHYASSQYFASEFKKKYGVSPKMYKYRLAGTLSGQSGELAKSI